MSPRRPALRAERGEPVRWLICALALALARPAAAGDAWTTADTAWEVSGAVLHLADWSLTLHTAAHPDRFNESNPLLGAHPSKVEVSLYMAGWMIVHPLVSYHLPHPYRRAWQMVWIGVEGGCVATNLKAGLRFDLP